MIDKYAVRAIWWMTKARLWFVLFAIGVDRSQLKYDIGCSGVMKWWCKVTQFSHMQIHSPDYEPEARTFWGRFVNKLLQLNGISMQAIIGKHTKLFNLDAPRKRIWWLDNYWMVENVSEYNPNSVSVSLLSIVVSFGLRLIAWSWPHYVSRKHVLTLIRCGERKNFTRTHWQFARCPVISDVANFSFAKNWWHQNWESYVKSDCSICVHIVPGIKWTNYFKQGNHK